MLRRLPAQILPEAIAPPAQAERINPPRTASGIVPALERQIAELKTQRAIASDNAGMWAQPMGEEILQLGGQRVDHHRHDP